MLCFKEYVYPTLIKISYRISTKQEMRRYDQIQIWLQKLESSVSMNNFFLGLLKKQEDRNIKEVVTEKNDENLQSEAI